MADPMFRYLEVAAYLQEHKEDPMFVTISKLVAMGYSKVEIQFGFHYWVQMHQQ